jgi:hypothetical protein
VTDFRGEDLTGSAFDDVHLNGARFHDVDLTGARFQLVDLTGVTIRGALMANMDISGELENVRINGVDVAPLVEAELDRRYPDRARMRPVDADGYREAWAILERLWSQTVARARRLDPDLLHEQVDGEYSFIETLRHLVFATDAWIKRAVLGSRHPGTRSTCRTMRCPTHLPSRVTGPPVPRWTRSSPCARTAWPPCARCSPASPTLVWPT